jgi:hypothetical protein
LESTKHNISDGGHHDPRTPGSIGPAYPVILSALCGESFSDGKSRPMPALPPNAVIIEIHDIPYWLMIEEASDHDIRKRKK